MEQTSEPSHVDLKTDSIASYFDVDGSKPQFQEKLKSIAEYLRGDAKEYDDVDMLRDLRTMMFKLGTPGMGTSMLDHAHSYTKLAQMVKQGQKDLERYMK